jgi:NADH:ubiquinone oxidoreductase subunit F (NADH-binding)
MAPNGTLPRLLRGVGAEPIIDHDHHLALHGPLPVPAPQAIIAAVDAAGLRGHGGAAFPTARKLSAVASRRRPRVVVANGTEGEPASKKDRVLMREAPHLVLDGVAVAARAVTASSAYVVVSEQDPRSQHSLAAAIAERRVHRVEGDPEVALVAAPERYLAGQESALVNRLNGGPGLPTFGPRPFERGVRNRPTLVQNVETLAHMAQIVRHGSDWFRALGTEREPGSTLLTLSGALRAPGVYEVDHGMSLRELLDSAEPSEPLEAVLVGGYFGTWLRGSVLSQARLAHGHLIEHGASLGAGVIVALGTSACPVAETARVADYFAAQGAGQCGPCVNGLGAIADAVNDLARGAAARGVRADLERWLHDVAGRGACQHPDGAVRFIASALHTFGREFEDHAEQGSCERCAGPAVLPTPALSGAAA